MNAAIRALLDGIIKARQLLLQTGAPVEGLSIRIHPHDYMTLGLLRSTLIDANAVGEPVSILHMPFVQDLDVPMGAPVVDEPDEDLLRDMWRDCADDLRRWARAFNDRAGLTVDSASYTALERLAETFEAKAAKKAKG